MRKDNINKLEIAANLLKVVLMSIPPKQFCDMRIEGRCKNCDPICKASNGINSALFWVEDTKESLEEEVDLFKNYKHGL